MTNQAPPLKPLDSAVVPRFAEPATFMRVPHVGLDAGLDIALAGVPFDLGATGRNGQRAGPAQVREMSRLIRQVNASTRVAPFEVCRVGDVGDAPVKVFDLMGTLDAIAAFYAAVHDAGAVPVSAGGDHTVTLPILRGIARNGPLACIQFDAHADTLDELVGNRYNHATPFRRAVEEGLIDPRRTVQVGLRGTRYSDEDIQYGYDVGMRVITMDDYEAMGRDAVIAECRRIVGDAPVYVTYDIDGLDPVYCPGTSAPEPGGLTMRDSQVMIRGLQGLDVIGGDVCEVLPALDPAGHTALNAANLM
ncbi:MAG TPA: agmatinase, partial [Pseudomonadales bacterium]|nr:agmatinase [Pseudomonadales bacterium]